MANWKGMLLVGSLTAVGGYVLGQVLLPASAAERSPEVTRELAALEARLDGVEHASKQQRRAVEVAVSSVHRDAQGADSDRHVDDETDPSLEPRLSEAEVEQQERQLMANLTLAARREAPDPAWARTAERSLTDGIAEASREAVPGVELGDVRCGSTKCALEATLPGDGDEAPQSAVRRLLMQPAFTEFPAKAFAIEETADGAAVLRVVMSRAGHGLEGVSRLEGPGAEGEN